MPPSLVITVLSGCRYFKVEDIEACERASMVPYVQRPQHGPLVRKGLFRKDEFTHEVDTNSMILLPWATPSPLFIIAAS